MLTKVTDPRRRRGKQHQLVFVLAVCVIATLAGARNYRQMADHAEDLPRELLRRLGAKWCWFTLRYLAPSKSTFRRILTKVDAAALDLIVGSWLFECARRDEGGEWMIALDGKVLRGAWTDENGQVTLFSAMLHDPEVTIAQLRVPDGTTETTQVENLLNGIELPDGETALITFDAAHTQKDTAQMIADRPGFDYLTTVKGNQPSLHKAIFDTMLPLLGKAPGCTFEEHKRGVIKTWSCWTTDAGGIDFPGARQIGCIRRDIYDATGSRLSKEFAFTITSREAARMSAADMNQSIRGHWKIENKSHYIRDTVWREDESQTHNENAPQNLAALRNLANGLLRLKGVTTIAATVEWISRDRTRALDFMTM